MIQIPLRKLTSTRAAPAAVPAHSQPVYWCTAASPARGQKQALHQTASCALINADNLLTFLENGPRGSNKGDDIVKFQSLISYVFALAAALFLAACGGGGATGNPNQ